MYECLRCGWKPLLLTEVDVKGKKRWKCGRCGYKTVNPTHYPNARYDMFVVEVAKWLWLKGLTLREIVVVLKRELDVDVTFGAVGKWVNGTVVMETGLGER